MFKEAMLLHRGRLLLSLQEKMTGNRACVAAFSNTRATDFTHGIVDPDVTQAKSFDAIPRKKGIKSVLKAWKDFFPFVGKFGQGATKSLPDVHMKLYKTMGVISMTKHGYLFVVDPEDIRKVFLHEGQYPRRDILPYLTKYRITRPDIYPNMGLLCENGKRWHHIRSKVGAVMLKPQITETYMQKMTDVSTEFVGRLHTLRDSKNEVPEFLNELYRWALESTGLVAFNTRLGCLSAESSVMNSEAQLMIQAVMGTFDTLSQLEIENPWQMFSSRSKVKAKLATNQEYIRSVANKYCSLTLEKIRSNKCVKDKDFGTMGQLLQREDVEVGDICTLAVDLLTAGTETTANTFAWTLYLLARNMSEQQKVLQQIDQVIPDPHMPITPQIVHELPLVRATVKETLRLLSPVNGMARILDHDVSLSGYRVPAGTVIFLATQFASLLPQNSPHADKFLPERWLSSTKSHPYANLPFGHGPRSCIGRRIALQELHILLIKILQRYRVEYHHEDIRRVSRLVNMPDGPLPISFIERN